MDQTGENYWGLSQSCKVGVEKVTLAQFSSGLTELHVV